MHSDHILLMILIYFYLTKSLNVGLNLVECFHKGHAKGRAKAAWATARLPDGGSFILPITNIINKCATVALLPLTLYLQNHAASFMSHP